MSVIEAGRIIGALLLLVIGLAAYLVPVFVARYRRVDNYNGVLILTLFLGWTYLGWVGALIWAAIGRRRGG